MRRLLEAWRQLDQDHLDAFGTDLKDSLQDALIWLVVALWTLVALGALLCLLREELA